MNLGLRTILLLVAVALFIIAVFADDPSNLWSLGLAAFAGAFSARRSALPTARSTAPAATRPS